MNDTDRGYLDADSQVLFDKLQDKIVKAKRKDVKANKSRPFDLSFVDGDRGTSYRTFHDHLEELLKIDSDDARKILNELYSCTKYDDFHNVVNRIADVESSPFKLEDYKGIMSPDEDDLKRRTQGSKKLKGDLTEIFGFHFLRTFGHFWGLSPMTVKMAAQDQEGYDFVAINLEGNVALIQSKFIGRKGVTYGENDKGALETFWAQSSVYNGKIRAGDREHRPTSKSVSQMLFTTAVKVAPKYEKLTGYQLNNDRITATFPFSVCGLKEIEDFTTDNVSFWRDLSDWFEDLVE
jgi:DNA-directed RNA polymerase subunit F